MNGNYEFMYGTAKRENEALVREAQKRRMAKQAGRRGGAWSTRTDVARAGAWLLQVADRAAGQVVDWSLALRQLRTSPH
ncbi:MAG: hypothetical protein JSW55_17300 [Chloroflexota bacterium]|nr:MAG: hypothetical protein JSW55_17300 [Chloroflexota bacterium]